MGEYTSMTKRGKSWYSEQGTVERPSQQPGMVALYRAGKFIAIVPATKQEKK